MHLKTTSESSGFCLGFSLIEATVTLAIVAILAVGMVTVASSTLDMFQTQMTANRLDQLQRAISGDPVIVVNETRTSFGYIGDMGNLPSNLEDLWVKGSQPTFTFDTTKKAGAGWNGPYLDTNVVEFVDAIKQDSWGNDFSYSTTSFLDSNFNANALGQLVSLGPDFSLGDSDDITINFFESETQSRIQGFVRDDDGNVVSGVGVTVNYPASGVLTTETASTDANGYYSLTDIPFGNRSLTIEPKLVLASGTALVTGNNNQNVDLSVKNFAATDTTITSIQFDYSISPPAYFDTLNVGGGASEYSDTTPRLATGDAVNFTGQTVEGTGAQAESVSIRLQSPVTDVADIVIGKIGKGSSLQIQMDGFNDTLSGSGTDVDITGVVFTLTFSDGSIVVFTPEVQ